MQLFTKSIFTVELQQNKQVTSKFVAYKASVFEQEFIVIIAADAADNTFAAVVATILSIVICAPFS